ncbi:ABC transporter ATP-binding protein [Mesorhizobium mediterraneum]|uniref:ABC transporter ATP-binding protein n=1 Tax=Mesorhizobium mediterraneum TaxID=43617 RepID=A0AB36QZR0_9HYPH|nr:MULTISPECIES: ABC transporter ATP-binding protein [Mesorhizobium]PAP97747.1 ABC transporter ATP-binding protein [Mesorhizobium mediterraneum]RWN24912.1 MAG: ABC transporter ATP-binding protein [Mesorhizobium sp.]RWN38668.1 MAG: ABC transporter ATP-binding protein [Mesorhizobium sp.]RWQ41627.1 MAG: ABC transporter ATP-binding protein [Mesorhizobium sp.]WIW51969.1 ABC transporter ATP-binding protein [Mesorhizobium mediterraneum]
MQVETIRPAGGRSTHIRHDDLISAKGVSVVMGTDQNRQLILRDIDLSVPKGSFVSLIGPSGCGKSTLLKVLAGLVSPSSGSVSVAGVSPGEAARKRMIGLVFQDANLLPWKNAVDNASMLLGIADKSMSRAALRARGQEMLELVGLGDAAHKRPNELSGGMRQRVAIARALALDPAVLLMDEPFGALDAITRDSMGQSLLEIWQRTGKTIVLVTHSIDEAIQLSRQVHVLGINPGRITQSLDIPLPYPRDTSVTEVPEFVRLVLQLRTMLRSSHEPGDAT